MLYILILRTIDISYSFHVAVLCIHTSFISSAFYSSPPGDVLLPTGQTNPLPDHGTENRRNQDSDF